MESEICAADGYYPDFTVCVSCRMDSVAVPHIPTIDGVYMVYPISWLIGAILMIIYTKKAFPKQVSAEI